ncbi:MAG TPA: PKD domain-containing protein, partial [Actinomycetes bacterium]
FEFGDGSSPVTQATPSVTHTYAVKGDYVLTVTVTDAAGLSDTESAAVSVNGTPTVSAGPDQLDQPFPGTVSLVGRATDDSRPNPPGALSYRWSKVSGPGSVTFGTGTASSTSASFSAQGVYVLRLTVNDSAATASDDVVVEMNAAPVAGLSVSPYSGMAPHTVTVDASGSADAAPRDIASYTFDFGDGSSPVTQPATDATVDHVYTAEGRFTVKVTVTDTGGRASQSTRRVLVGPNLAARAVTPSRILDTRTGNGAPAAMLGAGQALTLQVQGRGGLPASGVQAAVMNMTVTAPGTAGYLTVWPSGDSRPTASNLNFAKGATVANLVQSRVGSDGKVQIYNGSGKPVHVIADVSAWFGAQAAPDDDRGVFAPVSPYRALDTRTSGGPLGGAGVRTLKVTGTGGATGVPASGVEAVVLNVVAVSPTKSGYLTVYPGDKSRPTASNVNFVAGRTLANRVVVPVGSDGTVKIFNSTGRTNVVVDVSGWYTATGGTSALGSLYGTRGPQRLADSRTGSGGLSTFGPGATETLQVSGRAGVPGAGSARKPTAVVLNVTAVGPTRSGYLTVYPADLATRPTASDINFTAGQSVPNLVLVRLPANGKLRLFNSVGTTNVVVDVQGWYAGS